MDKRFIEEKYNISIIDIQPLLSGYACKKWVLLTDKNKYLLKEMNINRLDRLNFVNYIQNILAKNALTAKIITTTDANNYFEFKNNYYVLYQFINGNNLEKDNLSIGDYYELGYFLGKVHKVINSESIEDLSSFDTKSLHMGTPNVDRILSLINSHEKNNNREAIIILKSKLQLLEKYNYETINEVFLKYNNKIVHGDFYLDNLIKNEKLMCLDLDQTCIFPLQYEIFRAISMICYDKIFEDFIILRNIKNFLEGYKASYYMSCEFLVDGLDLFIYITLNSLYCLDVGDDISYAKYKFEMIQWLLKNKQNIVGIIEEIDNEKTNSSFSFSISKK